MPIRVFLSELKRRQVYRAIIVYATVAWVLLEGADIVFPRLGFEDQSVTLVLIFAIVGFPIAVYLAWVYDITPEGIFRTPPLSAGTKHQFSWTRITEFVLIGTLVTGIGYLYIERLTLQKKLADYETAETELPIQAKMSEVSPDRYRAIAVLPFADMSEAGDQAWFAEGIAEELLHALASLDELNVMARTSSFAFKDTDKTVADIAQILGVQAVLEGSVRRVGDKVRVTAQLIDAITGYHIWSGSYQRELTDIFQLQDELALSVVQTLRLKLGVTHSGQLVPQQTRSAEAYNWFIRGRALFDWSDAQTHLRSIEYFSKAVAADPEYALAWGHLAYTQASSMLWRPVDEVYEPARTAYDQALSLDPGQSDALAARALISMVRDHNWEAAARDLQPLITAGGTMAIFVTGMMLLPALDRMPDSISLLRLAEERDPMHAGIKSTLAIYLLWGGSAGEAIPKAREALAIDPGHLYALMALIEGYTLTGQYDRAEAIIQSVPEGLRQHPSITARVGLYYAARGDFERANDIFLAYVQSPPLVNILIICDLALALGEVERALELMQRAVDERSWTAFWIRIRYHDNALLENHPRYRELLRQIGLDDESVNALQKKLSF